MIIRVAGVVGDKWILVMLNNHKTRIPNNEWQPLFCLNIYSLTVYCQRSQLIHLCL